MSLSEITDARAVRKAVEEFDALGREAFLARYGFGEARQYFLVVDGKSYDSKAILGAAHGFQFPEEGPLRASDFSGGDATVKAKLTALGFAVMVDKSPASPSQPAPSRPLDGAEQMLHEPPVSSRAPGRADVAPSRVWVVLTFGNERQYAGNTGYSDEPGRFYSYDNYVPNHLQVAEGDVAIVCDKLRALGIARIERIAREPSTRLLQRCPVCNDTGIKKRISKQPPYRCNQKHEFEEPVQETRSCTRYTANFGQTFITFEDQFGREELRNGCPRYNEQLAMQEFDFARVQETFRSHYPNAAAVIALFVAREYLPPEAAEAEGAAEPTTEYAPCSEDNRRIVLRQIRARRGQQEFRDNLRNRYGDRCMISGCELLHVIEAAHIQPYRGPDDNHIDNGLLLRSDLHTLFDLDLIGIDPDTLTVHVSPAARTAEYADFHGKSLNVREDAPGRLALRSRWQLFTLSLPPSEHK
jgi:hypothetical protein